MTDGSTREQEPRPQQERGSDLPAQAANRVEPGPHPQPVLGRCLAGRTILVTGAAGGLGRACVDAVAAAGGSLLISDLAGEALDRVEQELSLGGLNARAIPARLGQRDEAERLVNACVEAGDPIDGLVACAGIAGTRPLLELRRAEWEQMLEVNLTAQFDLVQLVGARMVAAGGGAIVMFSSVAGRGGRSDAAHYAASKAAIISLTRSTALALGPQGVRVNAVCPGVIMTEMWEQRIADLDREFGPGRGQAYLDSLVAKIAAHRVGTPAEVANAVLFLLSDAATYVNGQALNVCGGLEFD